MEVTVRELTADEWPSAARLAGRAIFDKDYVAPVFGSDPLGRFVGMQDMYLGYQPVGKRLVLGSFAGSHLVATAVAAAPGSCHICLRDLGQGAGEDPFDRAFFELDSAIQPVHRRLPAHWYVAPVAVERGLQGGRLGSQLLSELHARAWAQDTAPILLECEPAVAPFYRRHGYAEVQTFAGHGFDLVLMQADGSRS